MLNRSITGYENGVFLYLGMDVSYRLLGLVLVVVQNLLMVKQKNRCFSSLKISTFHTTPPRVPAM